MKITLFMTISVNGIIARENGDEDFLSDNNWNSFVEVVQEAGCVIWGRKTYEIVLSNYGEKYLNTIKDVKKVVVSTDLSFRVQDGIILVKSPEEAIESLRKLGFNSAVVSGGSSLNSSFVKENLINEIILNVEPVVVGKGIPLFSSQEFDLKLSEPKIENFVDGIIQLKYKVL